MALWKRNAHGTRTGVHPVDEVLPPGPMAAYGLQDVLSVYAGVVAVPHHRRHRTPARRRNTEVSLGPGPARDASPSGRGRRRL